MVFKYTVLGARDYKERKMPAICYNRGLECVDNIRFTPEGGVARLFVNQLGGASVKGTVVVASTAVENGVGLPPADSAMPIGIIYENGIPEGSLVWVVIYGAADVLLEDATAGTKGNWVFTSDAIGRADATLNAPPGGGIPELDQHMQEIGHCLEDKDSGTDVLCRIAVHFN